MCPAGETSDSCFTPAQVQTITDLYDGPRDDAGRQVYPGKLPGSEPRWASYYIPREGNGMGHCRGGPGPNDRDRLAPLVEWVESGRAPEQIVATHESDGQVDNERPLCTYPEQARYVGPAGGANDPANWVAENFQCR